jgi:hypothetical protein
VGAGGAGHALEGETDYLGLGRISALIARCMTPVAHMACRMEA